MRQTLSKVAAGCLVGAAAFATTVSAQAQTAAPPAASVSNVVEKPTYIAIPLEITVNRPIAEVWQRVGKYCDIAEWLQIPAGCKILAGKDGEVGAVRSVANEVMVGRTEYSYTYTQTVKPNQPYNLYHGTLEARALTPTTTKLIYTIFVDNSMLPDDAAREKDKAQRAAAFTRALNNMKTLAEGGTLPPPPARPAAPAAPPSTDRK